MASDNQGSAPSGRIPVQYFAELDPLIADATVAPVERWFLTEPAAGGWSGFAVVNPNPGEDLPISQVFGRALKYHLVPGLPAALGLWIEETNALGVQRPRSVSGDDEENERNTLPGGSEESPSATDDDGDIPPSDPEANLGLIAIRTWPSVITQVAPQVRKDGGGGAFRVRLCDPITFLRKTPIWGVFRDCSPSELLGGALSLAVGGDGEPTSTPSLPGMPIVGIRQKLRDSLGRIPYAIASGEQFGPWLQAVLGRLGVRMEILGQPNGMVAVTLSDSPARYGAARMTVRPGSASAVNAVVRSIRPVPDARPRDTIVDNPSIGQVRRISERPPAETPEYEADDLDLPVETVLSAAKLGLDEATYRSNFKQERASIALTMLSIATGQPGLHPGRLVEFLNRPVSGAYVWQVGKITHGSDDGSYRNTVELLKSGTAWRPEIPLDTGAVIVSAVVDDGQSAAGATVSRDRLGRIPLTFVFLPTDPEGAGEAAMRGLSLPVIDPMAGGVHGFVPAHRQGDVCRVAVHQPMYAEIVGFVYSEDRSVGEELRDVSMGVIARHADAEWSGFLFRPKETVEEEEKEASARWRASNPLTSSAEEGSEEPEAPTTPSNDP